jgi:3-oxoacyl-[acyl-carrier protein] reductase
MVLAGRVAIVTGGGKGIGAAFSSGLAKQGASVLVADIDESSAKEVASRIRSEGGNSAHCAVDVADPSATNEMAAVATKAFPSMRDRGRGKVINVSSSSVFAATNQLAHYVASKMGVIGLTRALARELGEYNICVNALLPGITDSQTNSEITPPARHEIEAGMRSIKRVEIPADLVGTAVYLASDASNFMTGQSLLVDGGRYFH